MTQTTSSKPHRAHTRSPSNRIARASNILEPIEEYSPTFPPNLLQVTPPEPHQMASSSGLDLKTARHLSAALQIPFDRAQAVGSLRLFRPHHFQQLSKQRQGIGLTIQLSCPLKPFLHPGSWRIGSYSSHPSRLHPKLFVSAFVGYIRLIIPRNKQSYTPPSRS